VLVISFWFKLPPMTYNRLNDPAFRLAVA